MSTSISAEPIDLEHLLERPRIRTGASSASHDDRPKWLNEVIDKLGSQIMSGINAAAAVTPISLLAYVLLATPKQRIGAAELKAQLRLSASLMKRFRYSDSVTVPDWEPEEIIAHGEKLNVIRRTAASNG